MSMLPNYIIAVIVIAFLIYSFVMLVMKRAKAHNPILYVLGVLLALLLLGMSLYGIIYNIPLGQVQQLIESHFR